MHFCPFFKISKGIAFQMTHVGAFFFNVSKMFFKNAFFSHTFAHFFPRPGWSIPPPSAVDVWPLQWPGTVPQGGQRGPGHRGGDGRGGGRRVREGGRGRGVAGGDRAEVPVGVEGGVGRC